MFKFWPRNYFSFLQFSLSSLVLNLVLMQILYQPNSKQLFPPRYSGLKIKLLYHLCTYASLVIATSFQQASELQTFIFNFHFFLNIIVISFIIS